MDRPERQLLEIREVMLHVKPIHQAHEKEGRPKGVQPFEPIVSRLAMWFSVQDAPRFQGGGSQRGAPGGCKAIPENHRFRGRLRPFPSK